MKITSIVATLALLAALSASPEVSAIPIKTIALTGVDDYRGPGMGPGVTYEFVGNESPLLVPGNGQTEISFIALIPNVPNNSTTLLMRHDGSSVSVVLAEGAQAPGLPAGVTINDIKGRPLAVANGNFAQVIDLAGPGITTANNEAWLVGNPASPSVIQKGSVAPGTTALLNQMNEGRQTITTGGSTFTTSLVGPGVTGANDLATFYSSDAGVVELISREGAPVPGNPGLSYTTAGSGWQAGNSNYYFRTSLQGAGITSANDIHMLTWSPGGATTILAGNGLGVPGIAGATYVGELPSEQRNVGVIPDGSVLLAAAVTGGPFGAGTTNTILTGDAGGFTNAIPLGTTVPGTTAQLIAGRIPMVGDSDTFAFMGDMSDGTSGIMVMNQGALRLVSPKPAGSTQVFHVNALGDVAAASGTQWSIHHRNGNVLPIFDTAAPFDADSGPGVDLRTITGTNLSTLTSTIQQRRSGDGPVNFNELGQLVFGLDFEGGSRGLFLAAVPEPSSLLLFAPAGALLFRRRRAV